LEIWRFGDLRLKTMEPSKEDKEVNLLVGSKQKNMQKIEKELVKIINIPIQ
jgi:hypothetical protein